MELGLINTQEAMAKRKRWQAHPEEFIHQCLRIHTIDPDYRITAQQRAALLALGNMVVAKYKAYEISKGRNPEDKGWKPMTKVQEEMATKLGISIMSGRGIGKSAFLSWVIIWFLMLFDNARIVCTSTKQDQLRDIIWNGVSTWINARTPSGNYAFPFRDLIKVTGERMSYDQKDTSPRFARMAICQKNSNVADQQATLGGDHSDNMLILADEASGIPDAVFEPLERTMTGRCNLAILTFNPLKNNGYAYDTHYHPKIMPYWHQIHWNAEESELVSKQSIESALERYGGKDTDGYRVNILGLPPTAGEGVLIPYSWVSEATMRDKEPDSLSGRVLGVDPARHGDDKTVLVLRQGSCILDIQQYAKLDVVEVADLVINYCDDNFVDACFIDTVGVGGGVFDHCNRYKICKWYSVEASRKSTAVIDRQEFRRLRDELWWKCRKWFSEGQPHIPNNRDLIDQLTDVKYSDDSGKIVIESKKDIKKRLGGSPDIADALNLTFFVSDRRLAGRMPSEDKYDELFGAPKQSSAAGWMAG